MKEVIVINYTGRNGAGPIVALEMARGFSLNGQRIVAILSKDISNKKEWESSGFEKLIWIEAPINIFVLLKQLLFFRRLIGRKIKYSLDVYKIKFIYCPMVSLLTHRINKLFKKEKVCVVNHDPIPHSGDKGTVLLNFFGMQNIYKSADCIILHSNMFIETIKMLYGANKKICCVPLGPHNVKGSGSPKLSYNSKYTNFLFFGRIEKYKGIQILLKAYQQVKSKYSQCSLTIVGNGDFSPYATLANSLNDCTVINRWIKDDDVGDYFLGKNLVLVLPYLNATQSGPILIGYQYGIPAIVTNTGGLRSQVNAHTGIVVEPGDIQSLAKGMEKVCNNPEWIPSTQGPIKEYLKEISWEKSAKTIVDYMNSLGK